MTFRRSPKRSLACSGGAAPAVRGVSDLSEVSVSTASAGASVNAEVSGAVGTWRTSLAVANVIPANHAPLTVAGVRSSVCSSPSSRQARRWGSALSVMRSASTSRAHPDLCPKGVELGFLRREADPDDARRTLIALTDKGRAITNRFRGAQRENVDQALSAFHRGREGAAAHPLLTRLADATRRSAPGRSVFDGAETSGCVSAFGERLESFK